MLFSRHKEEKNKVNRDVRVIGNAIFMAEPGRQAVRIENWIDEEVPGIAFSGNSYSNPFGKREDGLFSIQLKGLPEQSITLDRWVSPEGPGRAGAAGGTFFDTRIIESMVKDLIENGDFHSGLS